MFQETPAQSARPKYSAILLSVVGDGFEGGGRAGGGRGGSRFGRAARDTTATPAGREKVGYLLRHFVKWCFCESNFCVCLLFKSLTPRTFEMALISSRMH